MGFSKGFLLQRKRRRTRRVGIESEQLNLKKKIQNLSFTLEIDNFENECIDKLRRVD